MRRTPVKHVVDSYKKDDGTKVRKHTKGSGAKKTTPKMPSSLKKTTSPILKVPRTDRKLRIKGPLDGRAAVQTVMDALKSKGLYRVESSLRGGELTGWTNASGSTGQSVKVWTKYKKGEGTHMPDFVDWHITLSGKTIGLSYDNRTEWEEGRGAMSMHVPIHPESVLPKINYVFEKILGLKVKESRSSGWQEHWDDDVDFNIITKRPKWLADPTREELRRFY